MFLAKALYDNIAESPDEIAFRRGDVLTVVELDTAGLDGWWLCSLRGKQGIAPGNRLKILSGMSDYSYGEDSLSSSSENLSVKKSLDHSFDKGLGQSRSFLEDEPNRSLQDYDVPPSRHIPKPVEENNQEGCVSNSEHQTYDVPQQQKPISDGRTSNRSSILSTASIESPIPAGVLCSPRSSSVPSVCDSARSSLDVSSQELYDTPSKTSPVTSKQWSADSGLDIYDTPPKAKSTITFEDYDIPKKDKAEYPMLAVPFSRPELATKQSNLLNFLNRSTEDVYDIPKSNAPCVQTGIGVSSGSVSICATDSAQSGVGVYDIPPQVTRDSVISSRSDSSEEGQRLSTCSSDSRGSLLSDIPLYDELPLEMDAALELLTKLQQDLQTAVYKFSGFVSSTWRKKESLQTKLYDIKLSATSVKNSLQDFIQFSQGTVANSSKLPDKKLVNKLYKQLNPLQNSQQLISSALKNLDEIKWQIDILAEPMDPSKSDDLGQIAGLCKDLGSHVRKLASLIQGNSTLLFSRSMEFEPIEGCNRDKRTFNDSTAAAKPPIGPKPPELCPKKNKVEKSVQQRPLPPTPSASRPLPPTPIEDQMNSLRLKFDEKEPNLSIEKDDIYANDTNEWISEYDYVHLETNEVSSHMKFKGKIEDFVKGSSPECESECEQKDLTEKVEDPYEMKLEADLEDLDYSSRQEENDSGSFDVDCMLDQEVKTPVNVNGLTNDVLIVQQEDNVQVEQLDPNDKQVLVFYSGQMETHSTLLSNALDAFFNCVESNEPPKVFISHSKFVIVSAHKLVYIGDSLHRNIMASTVRDKIMQCANQLCDRLKLSVNATKLAALQYPSVPAVQEMVDSVVAVSKAAHTLKVVISHAASL